MTRPPPPLLAVGAALWQRVLSAGAPSPSPLRLVAAASIAAVSATLASASVRQFRRQRTTLEPFHPDRASSLVTTGANAVSRNPMYVGMAGLLLANAVRLGSRAALVPVAAFALVIDRLQIAAEEAALLARFGADYEAYRDRVPRWLGARGARAGQATAGGVR